MIRRQLKKFGMLYLRSIFLVILAFSGFESVAQAQLFPNMVGERQGTLPKGRFMLSGAQVNALMDQRFSSGGAKEEFSSLFNRTVTWNEILKEQGARKSQVAGLLLANGVSPDSDAGRMIGNFSGRVTSTVPVLGYGISNRVGVFFALPVLKFDLRSNAAFLGSTSSKHLVSQLEKSGQHSASREFAAAFSDSFSKALARAGYDYQSSYTETYLGDLRVDVPIVIQDSSQRFQMTWSQTLIAPTAQRAPVSELFGLSGGLGRWMLGTRAIVGAQLPNAKRIGFTSSVGALMPFAATQPIRMTPTGSPELTQDVDPSARVSGGFQFQGYLATHIQWSRSAKTSFSIQHQQILDRDYSGTRFSNEKYALISNGSGERLDSFQFNLEFDSIPAFLSGDFLIPGILNIGVALPFAGKNTLASTAWLLQGSTFF